MMLKSIVVVVGIVFLLTPSTVALAVPTFGNTTYTTNGKAIISTKQQSSVQSLRTMMTTISNQTAAQIIANSHLPGIGKDSIIRTIQFQYWKYNGTIPWANDTVSQYVIYIANPATLAVNWTDTRPFIGNYGDHAFFISKNDTSDKYIWVVTDKTDKEKYEAPAPRYFYLYYVDAFSGKILAYDCACCGVCT
ncbi:hypothetical protein NTE_01374 [Candidatus Nitrososphaera evergladensis SR1]|uniref:Uncharacterized protein n=1 Tax=Candidatus Nitrososphaera evergladensis SR1 TaxID=1459636 RepID=A0A075MRK1_9ARCH|nr:hypothetical protein [Candidatus Nitrososphaera evergladensis]AIF83442.1 hypothetical protein NTE_01374 [Candidatus Nitrososphaera evergladensis SR1]